jgi:hypothetical protein
MKEETSGDAVLREFLLGGLDEEQRVRIEDQFLTDSQTWERVLAAEQELMEDYLEDSLTTTERERFIFLYARTSEQRRKLRITKSIKDWATTEAALPRTIPAIVSGWDRWRSWLRVRPAIVPIAVAILIALVIVAVWLNRRIEERNRVSAIEQELAQLNSPSNLRETPPQMVRLGLLPVAARSGEQPKEIALRDDVALVEPVLPWTKERYALYRARLSRVGEDGELYTIPNLQAGSDAGYTVRLRLSTHILRPGHYKIELIGIAADGSAGQSEEYTFAVIN